MVLIPKRRRGDAWTGPAPVPADGPLMTRRLVHLANLVPAGRWISLSDLVRSYSASFCKTLTPVEIADALLPAATTKPDAWFVPWHRMRLDDGRPISRKYGIVGSDADMNRLFSTEGGDVHGGAATADCRFDPVPC